MSILLLIHNKLWTVIILAARAQHQSCKANNKEKEVNTPFLISRHSIRTIPSGKCEEVDDREWIIKIIYNKYVVLDG